MLACNSCKAVRYCNQVCLDTVPCNHVACFVITLHPCSQYARKIDHCFIVLFRNALGSSEAIVEVGSPQNHVPTFAEMEKIRPQS